MDVSTALNDLLERDEDEEIYDPDVNDDYHYGYHTSTHFQNSQRPVEYIDVLPSGQASSFNLSLPNRRTMLEYVGESTLSYRRSNHERSSIAADALHHNCNGWDNRRGSLAGGINSLMRSPTCGRHSSIGFMGSSRRSSLTSSFTDQSFMWNASTPDEMLLDDCSETEVCRSDIDINNSFQKLSASSISSATLRLCDRSSDSKGNLVSPDAKGKRTMQGRSKYLPGSLECYGEFRLTSSSQRQQQQQQHQNQHQHQHQTQTCKQQRRRNSTNSQTTSVCQRKIVMRSRSSNSDPDIPVRPRKIDQQHNEHHQQDKQQCVRPSFNDDDFDTSTISTTITDVTPVDGRVIISLQGIQKVSGYINNNSCPTRQRQYCNGRKPTTANVSTIRPTTPSSIPHMPSSAHAVSLIGKSAGPLPIPTTSSRPKVNTVTRQDSAPRLPSRFRSPSKSIISEQSRT